MSRNKRRSVPKSGPVWRKTATEGTRSKMPKYNAYACGAGVHGDVKYNRARQKQAWQREMNQEDARRRGRLPLLFLFRRGKIVFPSVCGGKGAAA